MLDIGWSREAGNSKEKAKLASEVDLAHRRIVT